MLAPAERTPTGYRDYEDVVVDRMAFVRAAQTVGLTLGEIREIVALRDLGETPCTDVTDLIHRRADPARPPGWFARPRRLRPRTRVPCDRARRGPLIQLG